MQSGCPQLLFLDTSTRHRGGSRVDQRRFGQQRERLFVQGRTHYLSRTVPRIVFLGMIILGVVGATAVILDDLRSNPSAPRGYYLVPAMVWAIFFEILLIAGWQLSQSRFVVWSNGFSPPFLRPRTFGPRLPPVIR